MKQIAVSNSLSNFQVRLSVYMDNYINRNVLDDQLRVLIWRKKSQPMLLLFLKQTIKEVLDA